MKELAYSIKKDGRDNYLVIRPADIPVFEMELLNRREVKGNLPLEIAVKGGTTEFWYRLTGCISMRTLLELKRFGEGELQVFIQALYTYSKELEKHMLNPVGMLLSLDTVFFKEGKKVFFCYSPMVCEELKIGLMEMVEELLTLADYKNDNMIKYLYYIYEELNQQNPNYEKLQTFAGEVANKTEHVQSTKELLNEEKEQEESEFREDALDWKDRILKERDKLVRGLKDKVKMVEKRTKKTWETYTDFRPVIIKPQQQQNESPTVFLGEGNTRKQSYCLQGQGENDDCRIPLLKEQMVLGKNVEAADEVIEDESVSRVHAFITKEEGNYYLEDLNSLNGTFLNGERLAYKQRVCLKENDMIGFGRKTFCFCAL